MIKPQQLTVTPAEVLAERLSDIALCREPSDTKLHALVDAAAIAIPTILRAAEAGNIQCQQAEKEMQPFLTILTTK